MKKLIRKVSMLSIVLFMVISLLFPSSLSAATYNVQERFLGNWTAVAGGTEGLYGNGTFITANGDASWCFQANKAAAVGPNNEITPEEIGLSRDVVARLSLIAWYGYKVQPTDDNYVLTQNLIWQELGYLSYYKSSTYPNKSSMQSWFNNVLNQVDSFANKPSFNGKNYELNVNETLTVVDENGVLSGLEVSSISGATVSKSGNTLYVTPNISSPDTITIRLNRGLSTNQTRTNFIVRQGNSQAVSPCLSGADPYLAGFTIKVNKFGSLEIAKQDNKGVYVPDTSFTLSYNSDMSVPIGTYTTGVGGKVLVNDLLPQKVYIQETAVPNHLLLDSAIYSKDIVSNTTTAYNATNNWKQGYIQAVKKDKDSGKVVKKAGTVFNVYKTDNTLVATITTDATGYAKTGLLDYGDYYIQESKAPNGFTIDPTKYPVNVRTNLETVEQVISNKEVRGTIILTKEDSETVGTPQGNASLLGAKYKLYARSNIIDPADGSILISANSLIGEKEVDANKKIVWDNLNLGDYYVQESKAPVGYNIDPTKHNVSLSYKDQNTAIVTASATSKEDVIRGNIYLVKYLDNSIDNPSLQKPGKNIVFKITSKTTGQSLYIKTNEHGHASTQSFYYKDEACTNKVNSNPRGALQFDTYTIQEVASTTPPGYNPASPWEVKITGEGEVLHYIVENTDITTPVKVIKVDKTTGQVIPVANTEFKLLDSNKNQMTMTTYYPETVVHETFKTSATGSFQFPNHLAFGTYYLEEVNAPEGYLKGELLEFKVTSTNTGDWTNPLVVEYSDVPAMGRVKVHKVDETTQDDLANTVLEVRAREDIVTPDGTVKAIKDEVVDTLTTDQDGLATSKELFLGKYYIKEVKQVPGFVLSDKEYDFELIYKDQDTSIVEDTVEVTNVPTELNIIKMDKDTEKVLPGIKYKIWNQAIENIIENEYIDLGFGLGNNLLDPIFNFMTTYTTDQNGRINLKYLMPGTYKIIEVETLPGYILDSTIYEFTIDQNGLIEGKPNYDLTLTNEVTKTTFSKTDMEGNLLEGAEFDIIDPITKEVVTSFTSKLDATVIEKLIDGKEYILRETKAPVGYVKISEDIIFTVDGTNDSIKIENEVTKTTFSKVDTEGNLLEGAEFNIIDPITKEVVTSFTSKLDATVIEKLIDGKEYILRETKAPVGYVKISEDIIFTVDGTNASIKIENEVTKTTFSKVDTEGNLLEGAEFDIIDPITKEVVTSFTSKLEPVVIEKLIDGKEYILRETKAPDGYTKLTEDISFTVDGANTSITVVNEMLLTQIEVNKVDSQTMEPIVSKDFEFTMYADKECTKVLDVVNANTIGGTATFKDVSYGQTVYIKETKAPEGYLLSEEIKVITLDMDLEGIGEVHSFVYQNAMMPIIVETPTNDTTNVEGVIGMLLISLASCISLAGYKKYKGKKKRVNG